MAFDLNQLQNLINTILQEIQRANMMGEPVCLSMFSTNNGNNGGFVLNLVPNKPEAIEKFKKLVKHMNAKQEEIIAKAITEAEMACGINQNTSTPVKEPEKVVNVKTEKNEDGTINIIFDNKN